MKYDAIQFLVCAQEILSLIAEPTDWVIPDEASAL